MMHCSVITIFPEMFKALEQGMPKRAIQKGLFSLKLWDPRGFTTDPHQTVDSRPYGGGPGMVMKVAPLWLAIKAAKAEIGEATKVVYLSPQGRVIKQRDIESLLSLEKVIFVAGRYEGVDERLCALAVDEEWSIGDYVLSGGELAAMVVIDSLIRLIPGVLGDEMSNQQESFSNKGLLDWPHYTRPDKFANLAVPEVLLSGDHTAIRLWRVKQQLWRTWTRRPDLLGIADLSIEERELLAKIVAKEIEI